MTLTIQKLVTKAKIPRPLNAGRALVDQVARERFGVECARQLDRPWPVALGVVRIRKLRVRVALAPLQLKPDALAAAWVAAFIRELFVALTYPSGVGPLETLHFETRAEYLAAVIRDLMTGVAAQRWEYEEFGTALNLSALEAALVILDKEPSEIVPALLILERWGVLDRFLTSGNEAGLERLIGMVDRENEGRDDGLAVDDLIVAGRLLCSHGGLLRGRYSSGGGRPPGSSDLGTSKLVLKLFVLLCHDSGGRNAAPGASPRTSPRKILSALRALAGFLRVRESMAAGRRRLHQLQLMLADLIGHSPDGGGSTRGVAGQLHEGVMMPASSVSRENRTGPIKSFEELIRALSTGPGQPATTGFLHRLATAVTEIRTGLADLVEELILTTSPGSGQPGAGCRGIIATGNSATLAELARILEQLRLFIGCSPDELQVAEFCNLLTAASSGNRSEVTERLVSVLSSGAGHPGMQFWRVLMAGGSAGQSLLAEPPESLRAAAALGGRRDLVELLKQLAPALAGSHDQACATAFANALAAASDASRSDLTRLLEQLRTAAGSGTGWTELAKLLEGLGAAAGSAESWAELAALVRQLRTAAGGAGRSELANCLEHLLAAASSAGRSPLAESLDALRTAAGIAARRDVAELLEKLESALAGGQNPARVAAFANALATAGNASRSGLTQLLEHLRVAAGTGGWAGLAKLLEGSLAASGSGVGWVKLAELVEVLRVAAGSESWTELTRLTEGLGAAAGTEGWAEPTELIQQLRTAAAATAGSDLTELPRLRRVAAGGSEGRSDPVGCREHLLAVIGSANRSLPAEPPLEALRAAAGIPGGRGVTELLQQLAAALASGQRQARVHEPTVISTGCAGLFFLIRILDRLEWLDRLTQAGLSAEYGPRALTYTLAGLALAVLDRFDEEPRYLDPGLALFCGWLDGPDLAGLRHFLASEPFRKRRDLLTALLEDELAEGSSDSWRACFDALATRVIQELAGRIRGFGRASRSYVLKNFIALPGRIRIEATRLEVLVAASPLNLVLHLSGMDYPVEAVTWLAGRRVEFQLEGL